jgi:hypothetical protein
LIQPVLRAPSFSLARSTAAILLLCDPDSVRQTSAWRLALLSPSAQVSHWDMFSDCRADA